MEKKPESVVDYFLDGSVTPAPPPNPLSNETISIQTIPNPRTEHLFKQQKTSPGNSGTSGQQAAAGAQPTEVGKGVNGGKPSGLEPSVALNNPYASFTGPNMNSDMKIDPPFQTNQLNSNFYCTLCCTVLSVDNQFSYHNNLIPVYPAQSASTAPRMLGVNHSNSFFYPVQLDPAFPPQPSAPMFSPYFNQSYQSFYQPKPQPDFPANRSFSTSQVSALSQPSTAVKEEMKSGLSSFDSLLTSSLFKEDSKEVKLSRDRAAARLRRMRKKATIETTEIKIEFIKSRIKALNELVVGDRRTGLFSALDCIGGLVFSHNERTNQYLFLFQIWKQLHQRQRDCATLASLLLWTLLPEGSNAAKEEERLRLQKELALSESQKVKVMSLIQSLENLQKRLEVIEWCILSFSSDTNYLLHPGIDKGNELFTTTLTSSQIRKLHMFFKENEAVIGQLPTTPSRTPVGSDVPPGLFFHFGRK